MVVYNPPQIINARDNTQALHTLWQQDGGGRSPAPALEIDYRDGLHPLPWEPTLHSRRLVLLSASSSTVWVASAVTPRGKWRPGKELTHPGHQHISAGGVWDTGVLGRTQPGAGIACLTPKPVFVE